MDGDRQEEAEHRRHQARGLALRAVLLTALGLLAIVVLIGLWRNTIDPTGTASILAGVIGLVASLLVKGGGEK